MAFPPKESGMPPPKKPVGAALVIEAKPKPDAGEPKAPEDEASGKESPEEAIVLRSGDKICGTCAHFMGGECAKVEGQFEPEDRCLRYWEAMGGDEEMGEPEGMDAMEGEPMGMRA